MIVVLGACGQGAGLASVENRDIVGLTPSVGAASDEPTPAVAAPSGEITAPASAPTSNASTQATDATGRTAPPPPPPVGEGAVDT